MTVLNVMVEEKQILILSDSLIYKDREPLWLCRTKTHLSSNGVWAVSFRGKAEIAAHYVGNEPFCPKSEPKAALFPLLDCADITEAVELIEATIDRLREFVGDGGENIILAGPSHEPGRVTAIRFWCNPFLEPEGGWHRERLNGLFMRPFEEHFPADVHLTAGQFLKFADIQHTADRAHGVGAGIGGVKTLTTVTPAGASQRIAGVYADYDEMTAALGGDPNAADLAGLLSGRKCA